MKRTPTTAILVVFALAMALTTLLWRLLGGSSVESALAQNGPNRRDEIIFIDDAGRIRVLDLTPLGLPKRPIQWQSPWKDGKWSDLDTGDFNADGDAEIVAIQTAATAATSVLGIYDPVISSSNEDDFVSGQISNTIPWARLYTLTIPSTVTLVAAGNLDANIPGDEILYGVIDEDLQAAGAETHERFGFYLLRSTSPHGRTWLTPTEILATDTIWTQIRIGNIDEQGNDEMVLVDEESGFLHVYRIDVNGVFRLFANESESRSWTSAEIGQWDGGGPAEIIAGRRAPLNFSTFWSFRYAPSGDSYFVDRYNEFLAPPPNYVFFADVNGNGDEEAFVVRDSTEPPAQPTPTPPPRPHLIMRNRGTDTTLPLFEVFLDADSGYRIGAGGDVDDDGRDEVVVARNNNIRIYTDPEINATLINNQVFNTNGRTLRIANLDVNGYLQLPLFQSAPSFLTVTLSAGTQAEKTATVLLGSDIANQPLDFTVRVVNSPSWLRLAPTSGRTPMNFQIFYNAYGLAPLTPYTATILAESTNVRVANSPFVIGLVLRVTPGLWPQPSVLSTVVRCDQITPLPVQVQIGGLLGVRYNARLDPASASAADLGASSMLDATSPTIEWPSAMPWATLSGNSSILPTTLTLAINPSQRSSDLEAATLRVSANDNQNQPHAISIPISMSCATSSLYMPLVAR